MKIIFSSYDDISNPYYNGGGARATHQIAKRLATKFEVLILTGNYPNAKDETVEGVVYKRIGTDKFGPKIGQLVYQFVLPFYCLTNKFDVWVESFTPPFSVALLPLFTKKPVIGMAQLLSGKDMTNKYHLPFYLFENWGLKFYRNVIVLTQEEKRRLETKYKQMKVTVIPNGVNDWPVSRNKRTSEKYIFFLGRFDIHQKGLDLLLPAWQKVKTAKAKLILAGNGSPKEIGQLKSMIAELKLEKSVQVVGKVHGKTKQKLLENCRAMVLPSRFESFAIVALEALQVGRVIITFDIPGLNWIPNKFKLVAKSFSVDELAEKMTEALEKTPNKRLSSEAMIFSEKFNWQVIAQRFEKLLWSKQIH